MTPDSYRYLVLRSNAVRERTDGGHWGQYALTSGPESVDDLAVLLSSEGHYLVVPLDEDRRPQEFKVIPGPPVVEAI